MSAGTKLQAPERLGSRIDVAISEKGASAVVRRVNQLADAAQKLSPALAASLRAKALRVGISTDAKVKDVAVAILDKLVHTTPRDTGRARANWITTIRASRPHNTPLWEKYDFQGDATVQDGQSLIRSAKRPLGSVIYISNALPYIEALNNGWSRQAPAAFVEMAVQAGSVAANRGRKAFGE